MTAGASEPPPLRTPVGSHRPQSAPCRGWRLSGRSRIRGDGAGNYPGGSVALTSPHGHEPSHDADARVYARSLGGDAQSAPVVVSGSSGRVSVRNR